MGEGSLNKRTPAYCTICVCSRVESTQSFQLCLPVPHIPAYHTYQDFRADFVILLLTMKHISTHKDVPISPKAPQRSYPRIFNPVKSSLKDISLTPSSWTSRSQVPYLLSHPLNDTCTMITH